MATGGKRAQATGPAAAAATAAVTTATHSSPAGAVRCVCRRVVIRAASRMSSAGR